MTATYMLGNVNGSHWVAVSLAKGTASTFSPRGARSCTCYWLMWQVDSDWTVYTNTRYGIDLWQRCAVWDGWDTT